MHASLITESSKQQKPYKGTLLGGSWVVMNGVRSLLVWVITFVTLLITPLISAHELLTSK